jgi:two-component system, NtrC family, sensor histidine kinase HydH
MPNREKSRKRAERDAREEVARRLAFIGTLASGLAHEIRSPLNSLRLNVELLKEDIESVKTRRRADFARRLQLMEKEIDGLQKLLTEFLAFARPPRMEIIPTDLNGLLDEILEFESAAMARANIEVVRDYQKDLYPVGLDPNHFGRGVILNLLTNAREAIGQHGTVTLRTRETDDYVEIQVEDNGGGVSPENEEKIFEIFFSTKEHGTGLGLAIARRIVHEHGGELTMENHPGQGAIFAVRMPKSKILELQDERAQGQNEAGLEIQDTTPKESEQKDAGLRTQDAGGGGTKLSTHG